MNCLIFQNILNTMNKPPMKLKDLIEQIFLLICVMLIVIFGLCWAICLNFVQQSADK